jgi:hypothetical protein
MATRTYTATVSGNPISITYTVPELTDTANIQDALEDLTNSVLDKLKPYLSGDVVPSSTTNGSTTLINTVSGEFDAAGRVFVQSTEPADKKVGDVWMW